MYLMFARSNYVIGLVAAFCLGAQLMAVNVVAQDASEAEQKLVPEGNEAEGSQSSAEIPDWVRSAKPMPPLVMPPQPQGTADWARKASQQDHGDDFGTVTRNLRSGQTVRTPPTPAVKKAIIDSRTPGTTNQETQVKTDSERGTAEPISPSDENPFAKQVIDSDTRVRIEDTRPFPFKTVGQLVFKFPGSNDVYSCTGTIIGTRTVLTAAHCVYAPGKPENQQWLTEAYFVPALNQDTMPFRAYRVSDARIPTGYAGQLADDIALVSLENPAGNLTGRMPYGAIPDLSPFVGNIVGYPGDKQPNGTQWRSSCQIDPGTFFEGTTVGVLIHTCDTAVGQSGAAIYRFEPPNSRVIHGVHTTGVTFESGELVNAGVLLNEAWFQWLRENTFN